MSEVNPFAPARTAGADTESIDAIITALYEVISGPAGDRDWDRLRSLFLPGARLVPSGDRPNGQSGLKVQTVEEFIADAREFMAANSFFEREISRRVDRFGSIAQAFSTYESRWDAADPAPFIRGINSIQLVFTEGRWWVVTIFWDNESADHPIPDEYLP
jgi:hypothetical protein